MPTERTRESAWKAVAKKRAEVVKQALDPRVRDLTDEKLLAEIFEVEWSSQFEDERGAFQGKIRQIVNDRIDEQKLKKSSK